MIVSRLFGGLGNQMFQYAFGFALAQRFRQPLYYDLRSFNEYKDPALITPRSFSLDCFRLQSTEWPQENNGQFFPKNTLGSKVFHRAKRVLGLSALLYEQKRGFDPAMVAKARPNSYLTGYWQSHLYFAEAAQQLKAAFSFSNIPDAAIKSAIMACENPVAIHVRRGDYATNPVVLAKHGLLSLSYYQNATEALQQQAGAGLSYFIFSDDPEWCAAHFSFLPNTTVVKTAQMPEWYDMYLMTLCRHHIIANSTYSWWGAWLGSNPQQMVIAPAKWQARVHPDDWKLCPKTWMIL